MNEARTAQALHQLSLSAGLSRLGVKPLATLIDAACDALVAGIDSPSLRDLAGHSVHETYVDVDEIVEATFRELGLPTASLADEKAALYALEHYCLEYLAGRMRACDLAAWAHSNIGHEGPEIAQPIVDLDDDVDAGRLAAKRFESEAQLRVREFLRARDMR